MKIRKSTGKIEQPMVNVSRNTYQLIPETADECDILDEMMKNSTGTYRLMGVGYVTKGIVESGMEGLELMAITSEDDKQTFHRE